MPTHALRTAFATLALLAPLPAQNLVLNGDFENLTSFGCQFNLTNTQFTAVVRNATGFGSIGGGNGEICVMNQPGGGCTWGLPAQSGATKLGLATNLGTGGSAGVDAFSLDLSSPMTMGGTYRVSFHVLPLVTVFSPAIAKVEIGVSNSPTSFGTRIFADSGNGEGWTRLEHCFIAPMDASYLTVRNEANVDSWNHVDNFSLTSGTQCARCVFRNGTGINPADYTCLTRPVVQTRWEGRIAVNPNTIVTLLALAPGGVGPTARVFGGELLISAIPTPIIVLGTGTYSFRVPVVPPGAMLATQGMRLDNIGGVPTLVLLNAQDLLIGA